VSRRNLLTVVVVILIVLAACSAQAGTVTPTYPASTGTNTISVDASTVQPVSVSTVTPIPTASETPVPPALPVVSAPALARIDFQDANNGWGIAVNARGSVLRTLDGGTTWTVLIP
jgi:hypothetical protein